MIGHVGVVVSGSMLWSIASVLHNVSLNSIASEMRIHHRLAGQEFHADDVAYKTEYLRLTGLHIALDSPRILIKDRLAALYFFGS